MKLAYKVSAYNAQGTLVTFKSDVAESYSEIVSQMSAYGHLSGIVRVTSEVNLMCEWEVPRARAS